MEIITTASEDAAGSFSDYKKVFEKIGINNVGHIHHNAREDVLVDNSLLRISFLPSCLSCINDQTSQSKKY